MVVSNLLGVNPNMAKQNLRKEFLEKRNNQSIEEIETKSQKIKEKLFSISEFKNSKLIAFYAAFGSEVQTGEMISSALGDGKRIALPLTDTKNKKLVFAEIKNFSEDLHKGAYGIPEPRQECKKIPVNDIDLIVVPAIVFDLHGHRIGYGKGYYDTFLKNLPEKTAKIGLAFELQILDKLPEEPHDTAVGKVITEERVIECCVKKLKIGVLASTKGTDLQAIIDAIRTGTLNAELCCVISNKKDAYALERARSQGFEAIYILQENKTREQFDKEVAAELEKRNVELICLIGYMRILSDWFVQKFRNRIMNVHPSLLPAFAGGMNLNVHEAVLKAGVKETGCTIHFVTEEVDKGPIILQKKVPVLEGDTPETLKQRVQEAEKVAYVEAIRLFKEGKIKV